MIVPAVKPSTLYLYEPEGHALLTLNISAEAEPRQFLTSLEAVLSPQRGTVLWFAADHLRTATRYEYGQSLVARDAGALLATIGIAAEALNLNCCAYGITGDEWIGRVLPSSRFFGVGGCVIGSPTRKEPVAQL